MALLLRFVDLTDRVDLRGAGFFGQRHEDVGVAEISLVLGDVVLEDQMIAEGIPRKLTDRAVVLVQVVASTRQDQVGRELPPELVEAARDAGR